MKTKKIIKINKIFSQETILLTSLTSLTFFIIINSFITNYKGQTKNFTYFLLTSLTSLTSLTFFWRVLTSDKKGVKNLIYNILQRRSKRSKRSKRNVPSFEKKNIFSDESE
jgi:hypothetical protein